MGGAGPVWAGGCLRSVPAPDCHGPALSALANLMARSATRSSSLTKPPPQLLCTTKGEGRGLSLERSVGHSSTSSSSWVLPGGGTEKSTCFEPKTASLVSDLHTTSCLLLLLLLGMLRATTAGAAMRAGRAGAGVGLTRQQRL